MAKATLRQSCHCAFGRFCLHSLNFAALCTHLQRSEVRLAPQLQFHVPLVATSAAPLFCPSPLAPSLLPALCLPPENKMKLFCCRRLGFEFFLVCRTAAAAAAVAPQGAEKGTAGRQAAGAGRQSVPRAALTVDMGMVQCAALHRICNCNVG